MHFRVSFISCTFIALVLGEPLPLDAVASSNVRSMRSFNVKPSGGIETPLGGMVRTASKRTSSKSKQQRLSAAVNAAVRSETLVEKPALKPETQGENEHDDDEGEVTEESLRGDTDESQNEAQQDVEAEQAQLEQDIVNKQEDKDTSSKSEKRLAWCKVWGDPHIFTFDAFLGEGNFEDAQKDVQGWSGRYWNANKQGGHWWLAQRADDSVSIQGMYGPCTFWHDGKSYGTCLQGIAISGNSMNSPHDITQTLAVKTVCDWNKTSNLCTTATAQESHPRIFWNGNRLNLETGKDPLQHMTFKDGSTASADLTAPSGSGWNGASWALSVTLPGEVVVHMRFFGNKTRSSWVGKGAMSAHIQMRQGDAEQCGHCGNFNGNPADDLKYEPTGVLKSAYASETGKLCDAEVHCGSRLVPMAEEEVCEEFNRSKTENSTKNCRPPAEVIDKYDNGKRSELTANEKTAAQSCTVFVNNMKDNLHDPSSFNMAKQSCVDDVCEGFPLEAAKQDLAEAIDGCKVTLYEHWPQGTTAEKASSYYEASGVNEWQSLLDTWNGRYLTGETLKVYVSEDSEKYVSLANFTKISSVQIQGAGCTVRSFTNGVLAGGKCQGAPAGSMTSTTKIEGGAFTGEAGLVTPAENLQKILGCNDDTCGCIHVEHGGGGVGGRR